MYAGAPYLAGGGGVRRRSLTLEDLDIGDDGAFEVFLSRERMPGNWLENPDDGTKVFVRQVYGAWSLDAPGEVHIDRVGGEGALSPPVTEDVMAERLQQAAADLRSHVRVWPQVVQHFMEERPPNELGVPMDSGASGGVPGRWMVHGIFGTTTTPFSSGPRRPAGTTRGSSSWTSGSKRWSAPTGRPA